MARRDRGRAVAALRCAGAALLQLCLPRTCLLCDRFVDQTERELACGVCWSLLETLPQPRCARCGHPHTGPYRCAWCALLPPYVRAVRSVAWVPAPIAGRLVHELKYGGWTTLAAPMARRMAALPWPPDAVAERAALVPVPLSRARLRARGFNQSALLADALATQWGIPVLAALARARSGPSQTRLTPGERRLNVAGAFGVTVPRAQLAGRHLVLVDDVVTTAATLNAAADALFAGGARIISYITFGRARAAGDAAH